MKERYYSLDVFRGATVALMILVNNPGSWGHIYTPLEHAPWHGCTPTDLVFPFFLFAVGNAMAFVIPRLQQAGNDGAFWGKVLKRFAMIFLIGLFLNWSPFIKWSDDHLVFKSWVDPVNHDSGIRLLGVLQRIAICYLFASIIAYYTKPKLTFYIGMVMLLLFWWMSYAFGDSADPYSLKGFFGTQVDIDLLGKAHVYKGEGVPFDPEGFVSSFAAIVQVLMGYLVGLYIREKGKNYEMLSNLFVFGAVLIFAGFAWDTVYPINKKIWTSSYVVYTTGLALMVIGVLIYLLEFRNAKGAWSRFFDVFGKNPLFIFFLSGFLPRIVGLIRIPGDIGPNGKPNYLNPFGWFYEYVCKNILPDLRAGSLLYAICMIIMYWFFAWLLDRKKIYIKV
ncbi:MAG: heparan-alpha-glucosaminide N-acetyltransferase domain-containing protein [Chitinophagaceae bacterium]